MKATNLLRLILLMSLLVIPAAPASRLGRPATCRGAHWRAAAPAGLAAQPALSVAHLAWHPLLLPAGHIRQRRNAVANQRRWQQWLRHRPPVSRRQRRQRQAAVVRALLGWSPPTPTPPAPLSASADPAVAAPVAAPVVAPPVEPALPCPAAPAPGEPSAPSPAVDPLADLRHGRG